MALRGSGGTRPPHCICASARERRASKIRLARPGLEGITMGDPLATYLHDHLAGSVHAVSLLEFIRDQHEREPLGRFASGLLAEIEADRHVLQGLADRAGAGSSDR